MAVPADVDEYLAGFPPERREVLQAVRQAIHRAVPDGEERIRYGMPAVMLGGRYALHFAGWKKHLGLYPVATAPEPLESRIAPHRSGEDSVTFPWTRPVDLPLVEDIAAFVWRLRGDS